MMQISTILLTTDLSPTSREAFEPAVTLAQAFGAKIVVAYVEDAHYLNMVSDHVAVSMDAEHIWKMQHEMSTARLAEFVKENLPGSADATREVRRGIPHAEIVRMAEGHHADLIVMATHGRGFLTHAILGSTTERVIRSAPCPVLAVRSSEAG